MKWTALYAGCLVLGWAIGFPIATTSVRFWNTFADATDAIPELPKGTDTVATATLSGVIAWLLGRTIPSILQTQKDSYGTLATELGKKLDEMGERYDAHANRTHELLAAQLRQNSRSVRIRKKPPDAQ